MSIGLISAGRKILIKATLILNTDGVNSKEKAAFPSLYQSTAFKRELNNFKILGVGFADLNAHVIDTFLIGQRRPVNGFRYAAIKLTWIFSKLFGKKIGHTQGTILLAPAEPGKERSIDLYKPLLPYLKDKKYDLFSVQQLFGSINLSVFFKWLIKLPSIIRTVNKTLKNDAFAMFKEIRWKLFVDSLIYSLWILQLRKFFKRSAYSSVLVDWDRHALQALIVLAAKLENITTHTFVHGAIYTPEKFVPLIADKCLVWGNVHKKFFTNMGEDEKRLVTAGNTRFSKGLPVRQTVLNRYGIPADKKIILHPSQNFPDLEDHVIIKELSHFISKFENYLLVVKTHPSQKQAGLADKIKKLKNVVLLDRSATAKESLAIAEFVIVVSSTFSIDAMIAGVPVAVYKAGQELRGIAVDLAEKSNVPLLQSEKDFSDLLRSADDYFDMQAQKKFINDYCEYYGDESAAVISALL